jgi:3-carboxy-cis,cis-muconate cycloisomerase
MPQEHERAAGGWQAEWETLPALVDLTLEAARTAGDALGCLSVDTARMLDNLAARGGLAMAEGLSAALAIRLGRPAAMTLVERLSREAARAGRSLRDVAIEDADVSTHLTWEQIAQALAPEHLLGSAPVFIERVLARWDV